MSRMGGGQSVKLAFRFTCAALLLLFVGCSLPALSRRSELTFGHVRIDPANLKLHRVVPGIDLRIGSELDGLNVGYSSMDVLFPEDRRVRPQPATASPERIRYAFPAGVRWTSKEGSNWLGWFYLRRPEVKADLNFVRHSSVGLAINANAKLRGLELGFARETVLLVPPERKGICVLKYLDRDPTQNKLIQYEEKQPYEEN